MGEKTRYSEAELVEFKDLIESKIAKAQEDLDILKKTLANEDGNDTQDTSPTFKVLEEGATVLSREEVGKLAQRQAQFIQHLQAALVRVQNRTYGICRQTGKLISKERLRAVPHATLSIEAKKQQR
ncbi:MAG: TraR/DksA family transcriptional regulator [Bacteroidetes bacterium]|nr:TraR/DksA family transcriptional regulator [Bacteroidota bacterium]MBT4409235.1 TraR/DksA family transcriptional regulator [Bacteroidota bacterium]MBT5427087.1 TraR/DksA family transcriptional regulator [Bacteroidota bacterium]MBT7093426.1 TraR/DksA family transcriptional regulator [Bacteroidota bacterium]MBT7712185.1 TraR/DksA family transcriptional regulator [Deltaproteobacteria bacterium]